MGSSDNEDVATPTTRLRVRLPIPVVDIAERQNDCSSAELPDASDQVHDIDPQIDAEDSDSDDDDELSHAPSWYRFRPSTASKPPHTRWTSTFQTSEERTDAERRLFCCSDGTGQEPISSHLFHQQPFSCRKRTIHISHDEIY